MKFFFVCVSFVCVSFFLFVSNLSCRPLFLKKSITKDWLLGHLEYKNDYYFVRIKDDYSSRKNIYLHAAAYRAFKKMAKSAKKDGFDLKIISAARNFKYQKKIWEIKWERETKKNKYLPKSLVAKKILNYSAMPGTSRHHWGTEVDLNSLDPAYFLYNKKGKQLFSWLKKNAFRFGFCQVYSKKDSKRPFGYNEEKWHWSYMKVSDALLKKYKELVHEQDLRGFKGENFIKSLNIIPHYVLGIDPSCSLKRD